MRTLHLIESAHTGHTTSGRHAFLAVAAHGALALAAIYATTQPARTPLDTTEPRIYFVPEQRPAVATPSPAVSRPRPVERRAPVAVAQPKAAVPSAETPSVIPAAEAPLADPSVAAAPAAEPVVIAGDGPAGPTGNTPFDIYQVDVPAAALSGAGPDYPERAIRLGLSGRVSARFIVGWNGRVESDVVILDATSGDFAVAVRAYLRRARYSPARVRGEPVRQLVEQEFVFKLNQ